MTSLPPTQNGCSIAVYVSWPVDVDRDDDVVGVAVAGVSVTCVVAAMP